MTRRDAADRAVESGTTWATDMGRDSEAPKYKGKQKRQGSRRR